MRTRTRRLVLNAVATALTIVTLLVGEASGTGFRPHFKTQFRAPEQTQTYADTASTKRPLSLVQQRSLFTVRAALVPMPHGADCRRDVAVVDLRLTPPLPPARMRYRRAVHAADAEPPA